MDREEVLERDLKNRLLNETEKATELKEDIWNNISHELFPEQIKRRHWLKGVSVTLGTVAVIAIVLISIFSGDFTDETKDDSFTNEGDIFSGEDVVDHPDNDSGSETTLKDMFEHEKTIEIELEGMKEEVHVQLAVNEAWRTIIYFDKEGYKFIHGAEFDEIIFDEDLDGVYPDVGMEIRQFIGVTAEEVVTNITESLASDGMTITKEDTVGWPVEGVMIEGQLVDDHEVEWNTPIHRYYMTEIESGRVFVFKQKFYAGAWEGHAVRLDLMLESFEMIE